MWLRQFVQRVTGAGAQGFHLRRGEIALRAVSVYALGSGVG